MNEQASGPFILAEDSVERAGELSFPSQLNDPFAGTDSELEVLEEVEPQKTIYPAFCGQVMAQNFQVGDLLPNSSGRPYSYTRGIGRGPQYPVEGRR
jgi:hypothetical protein